jgi:hypothetical protein
LLFGLLFAEYLIMVWSGVTWGGLAGIPFFSLGVDPVAWGIYLSRWPFLALSHPWIGYSIDLITLWLIYRMFRKPDRRITAFILFVLLLSMYVTLTACITHRNYQSGFFWVMIPFLFTGKSRGLTFEFLRYFLLYFYVSAAFFKILHGGIWDSEVFSSHLAGQLAPYFFEGQTGWRMDLNLFLRNHPSIAFCFYWAGFLAEFSCLAGFFTRRYDRVIGLLLILFHIFNWIIMDISCIGQLSFLMILFAGSDWRFSNKYSFRIKSYY